MSNLDQHDFEQCHICTAVDENLKASKIGIIVETIHRLGGCASPELIHSYVSKRWSDELYSLDEIHQQLDTHQTHFVQGELEQYSLLPDRSIFKKAIFNKRLVHNIYVLCKVPRSIAELSGIVQLNRTSSEIARIINRLPMLFKNAPNCKYVSIPKDKIVLRQSSPKNEPMTSMESVDKVFQQLRDQKINELVSKEKQLVKELETVRAELDLAQRMEISVRPKTAPKIKPTKVKSEHPITHTISDIIKLHNRSLSQKEIEVELKKRNVEFNEKFFSRTVKMNFKQDSDGNFLSERLNPFAKSTEK